MSKRLKIGLGCLGVSFLLSLVVSAVLWIVVVPKVFPYAESNLVLLVQTAIVEFSAKHPDEAPQEGDNEAWAEALKNYELQGFNLKWLVSDGQLVSVKRVPLKIEVSRGGRVTVVAAGWDGIMDTADDIDNATALRHLEEMEQFANERKTAE